MRCTRTNDCCCDVDWTDPEVYRLREGIAALESGMPLPAINAASEARKALRLKIEEDVLVKLKAEFPVSLFGIGGAFSIPPNVLKIVQWALDRLEEEPSLEEKDNDQ